MPSLINSHAALWKQEQNREQVQTPSRCAPAGSPHLMPLPGTLFKKDFSDEFNTKCQLCNRLLQARQHTEGSRLLRSTESRREPCCSPRLFKLLHSCSSLYGGIFYDGKLLNCALIKFCIITSENFQEVSRKWELLPLTETLCFCYYKASCAFTCSLEGPIVTSLFLLRCVHVLWSRNGVVFVCLELLTTPWHLFPILV